MGEGERESNERGVSRAIKGGEKEGAQRGMGGEECRIEKNDGKWRVSSISKHSEP